MKVLIADKMAPAVVSALEALGCAVVQDPSLSGATLLEALRLEDPAVLVVRSTKVSSAHFDAANSLSVVVRAGAGVNTIAVDHASARGVYVANCPGKNAAAVAELTLGHMLNADRRIADNVIDLRRGQWKKKVFSKGTRGLKGRTLGLIGMGNIGSEVARRAHRTQGRKRQRFVPIPRRGLRGSGGPSPGWGGGLPPGQRGGRSSGRGDPGRARTRPGAE